MGAFRSPSVRQPASLPLPLLAMVGAALPLLPLPAAALEQIQLRLPLLETSFTLNLSELGNTSRLLSGNSDLAELDRAMNGAIGRKMVALFNAPLPLQATAVVNEAVGSPLLNQSLLLLSALGGIDGLPADIDGRELSAALDRAAAGGRLTLLSVLQALPGRTASVDLERALFALQRLARQQQPADQLLAQPTPASSDPRLTAPGSLPVQRQELSLGVSHRPAPLQLVLISPRQGASGRLVVISHGLWDAPESFEGWANHLASHGYTVLLPRHPGSDQSQQRAMLSGKVPPPSPAELRLRPLDVSALLDGVAAGRLPVPPGVSSDRVVVIGHSWGATTVLQLAGLRPSANRLYKECDDVLDPSRNLSWVLQCSFLSSADQAGVADPRVKAAVAVSPPLSLLFDQGAARAMQARVLIVSGSRDWVVPPGPEAITPMTMEAANAGGGHRLVLARGGDHFNLRAPAASAGAPLRGVILAWTNGAFDAGAAAAPGAGAPALLPPDGWGDTTVPLVDVSPQLRGPR